MPPTANGLITNQFSGFIKLHVGVDARTKKIYAVAITDDKCGDSPQFEELVEQAFANAEESPSA